MLQDIPYELTLIIFSFLLDINKKKLFKSFNKNVHEKATNNEGQIKLNDYYRINNIKNKPLITTTKFKIMNTNDMIYLSTIRDKVTHIISYISEFDYYNSSTEFPKLESLKFGINKKYELNPQTPVDFLDIFK